MLLNLYHKFTNHYPEFLFGYRYTDLAIKLSIIDKRTKQVSRTVISLTSSETETKLAWYTLLKELDPYVQATETEQVR